MGYTGDSGTPTRAVSLPSDAFVGTLEKHGIRISMDGKNRALDNIFVERFWRSLKYEDIYLKDYQTMGDLKTGLKNYFSFFNGERYHASLDYRTPDEQYYSAFSGQLGVQTLTA